MKWFNNLSVVVKLLAGFLLVALLSAVVGIVGVRNIRALDESATMLYQKASMGILYSGDISEKYQKIRVNLREILLAKDRQTVEVKHKGIDAIDVEVRDTLKKYETAMRYGGTADPKAEKLFKELTDSYVVLIETVRKVAVLSEEGKTNEAVAMLSLPSIVAIVVRIEKAINDVDDFNRNYAQIIADQNGKDADRATIIMIATIIGAVCIAILLGIYIAFGMKNPIEKGVGFAKKIAAGDFTDRIDLDQKDEIGELGKALNTAADDLEKIVADIIVGSQNLVQAIQEISAGNENLSQRTSEQASSLEEIASTIEETSASINQNAENSKIANDIAGKTTVLAEEGGRVVYEAVSAINEINEASKKIEEIISVINEIAFQTNLLALNAAVEAARAGEQGRGFAVVAGEVRNLAQRSGNAAKEIGELIKSTLGKVDKGTSLANKSGEALKEIIVSVKTVGRYVAEIAAASEEQRQGSSQINVAVSELDSMTQQNAGLVEETASASEEIANQAQELLVMMERFKISDKMRDTSFDSKHKEIHIKAAHKTSKKETVESVKDKEQPRKGEVASSTKEDKHKKAEGGNMDKILTDEGFEQF